MDNKVFLGKAEKLNGNSDDFPVFSENLKEKNPDAAIDEIDKISGSMREEDGERVLSMPPDDDLPQFGERGGNGNNDATEMMVQIGSDGKISNSEFKRAKNQLVKMADDPAMLNDAIQGLSEKIIGGQQ